MKAYVHITFDMSNYGNEWIDIAVSDKLTCFELVKVIFESFNLELTKLDNIILKINRNGYIITQVQTLQECGVRDGDVVTLL